MKRLIIRWRDENGKLRTKSFNDDVAMNNFAMRLNGIVTYAGAK